MRPAIVWFRRDLRLADNVALTAAARGGRAVVPLVILDELAQAEGAAARFRWGASLGDLAGALDAVGSRLIFRTGDPLEVLRAVAAEVGAGSVHWSRLYDPRSIARDTAVKAGLKSDGVEVESHPGHLLFEPWTVATRVGDPYKVYTPFWKAVRDRGAEEALPVPKLRAPERWPQGDILADWGLDAGMRRGGAVVMPHCVVGESAARGRLAGFVSERIDAYKDRRDFPAEDATSGLSENLTYGEISPAACWRAAAVHMDAGSPGAEHFLKELVWREFAYHLLYHFPDLESANFRNEWAQFPWQRGGDALTKWQRGLTGYDMVDAGMRELYVTGVMHNRVRMLVASLLTKHLMVDWRDGLAWFADTLIDWDPASNALGWQWVAGSGPDAAPYFRIYNPITQIEKFDADRAYCDRWLGDTPQARSFFEAIPESWGMSASDPRPERIVDHKDGRERALAAYGGFKS